MQGSDGSRHPQPGSSSLVRGGNGCPAPGTWSWSARTRPEPTQGSWVDICADIWVDLWCRPSLLLPPFSPCALGRKKTERAGEREKADAISQFFKAPAH